VKALTVVALGFCLGAGAPMVPSGAERPHPVALRRERLNRQRSHARKGKR
jgi:hypothetical protein